MAELRYLTIPKSIAFVVNGEKWSWLLCLTYVGDMHPLCAAGAGLRNYARVLMKFEGKKEGDVVALDEADWQLVRDIFESPPAGYIPQNLRDESKELIHLPPRVFLSYLEAVSDEATKTKPVSTANGVAALPVPAAAPELPAAGQPS
jgi:hypothetical protein